MSLRSELEAVEKAVAALMSRAKCASTLEDQVDIGSTLWKVSKMATKALEPLKTDLRKKALLQQDLGVASFRGRTGATKITISEPALGFVEDGAEKFKTLVSREKWKEVVRTRVSHTILKDEMEDLLRSVSSETKNEILSCLKMKSQTPRVSFKTEKS